MENWIERYVHDVTRRLPEKDRDDVSKELKSNISDMLPENASEAEIKHVLNDMGAPAQLAEKYRQNPRYLISPAFYDDYIHALKWIMPTVGLILMAVGMVVGIVEAMQMGSDLPHLISKIMSSGISMGVSGAFQGLFWTTIGFVIAERNGAKGSSKTQEWKIEDLPEQTPKSKGTIPLSDSITKLILTIVFSIAAIFVCSGAVPLTFRIQSSNIQIHNVFSPDFMLACIPMIAVMGLLSVIEYTVKMITRRWTPVVCGVVILSSLIGIGFVMYLAGKPVIFSAELTALLQGVEWGSYDVLRFMGNRVENPIVMLVAVIIVICSLIECGDAIVKTVKSGK